MTIYKPKNGGEKKLGKRVEKPPVVLSNDDVAVPLTQAGSDKQDEALNSHSIMILRSNGQQLERRFMKVFTFAAILSVFIFAACFGYFLHRKLFDSKSVIQTIHVQFHEYRRRVNQDDTTESRIDGGFFEQVEIDWKMERYEKLNIPPFIDVKRATIVHDFQYNLTAIVDRDESLCFVVPLNKTTTNPPKRLLEYVKKMRTGHSLPNAKVERLSHKVVTPPINDLSTLGDVILPDCQYFHTYRLVKAEEPVAMSRRFACEFSGDTYSLGGTGYPLMALFTLDECI